MAIKFGEGRPEDKPSQAVIDTMAAVSFYRDRSAAVVCAGGTGAHRGVGGRLGSGGCGGRARGGRYRSDGRVRRSTRACWRRCSTHGRMVCDAGGSRVVVRAFARAGVGAGVRA